MVAPGVRGWGAWPSPARSSPERPGVVLQHRIWQPVAAGPPVHDPQATPSTSAAMPETCPQA